MKQHRFTAILLYTLLLCWPASYRLILPSAAGDLLYYAIAYALPAIGVTVIIMLGREAIRPLLYTLGICALMALSFMASTSDQIGFSTYFFALKFYLTPILLIFFGWYLGRGIDSGGMARLLAILLAGQLVFSLVFYMGILPNPVYSAEEGFSENWTSVLGGYRAFIGLTLSKFDLAYQVGFVLVGLMVFRRFFASRAGWLLLCGICLALVIFTFNKTILLVIVLALALQAFSALHTRHRFLSYVLLGSVLAAIVYPVVLFLNGDLVLTELLAFLSPQTFWSRVGIWEAAAQFDWPNLIRGTGAGVLAQQDVTVDNQYLYAYLELGVLGAAIYFCTLGTLIWRLGKGSRYAWTVIVLLAAVFAVGDILNAVTVMYISGLYLGFERRLAGLRSGSAVRHRNKSAVLATASMEEIR